MVWQVFLIILGIVFLLATPLLRRVWPRAFVALDFLRTLILAGLLAIFIRTLFFEPFNIPSGSMIPNLLIGDYLFVSKTTYGYGSVGSFWGQPLPISGRILGHAPERGDVVVFKLPRDNKTDYIKRLIGLPGDRVQMRGGMLYINDVAVKLEPLATPIHYGDEMPAPNAVDYMETLPNGVRHVIRKMGTDMPFDNTPEFVVPAGHYFFMGDNRDNSLDSRTENVGFVPAENIVGKAQILFFSISDGAMAWQFWLWPWTLRTGRLLNWIH